MMDERRKKRMEALRDFLLDDPDDSFSRYALALELGAIGDHRAARAELEEIVRRDPQYIAAYHQLAQLHQRRADFDTARSAYMEGIRIAKDLGELHAASEMQSELDELV